MTALRNHVPISETITDRDEEVLKTLQDIRVSYLDEDQPGFKLHFKFGANDFFSDSELVKTYYYQVGDALERPALMSERGWLRR